MTTKFRVFVRDRPINAGLVTASMPLIGELDAFTSFQATPRVNAVGAWQLAMPAGNEQAQLIKPGRGVAVFLEGSTKPIFSGPIGQIERTWSKDSAGGGMLTVSGPCDNTVFSERIARGSPRWPLRREGAAGETPPEPKLDWAPTVFTSTAGDERPPINSAEFIWGLVIENFRLALSYETQDDTRRLRTFHSTSTVPASVTALGTDDIWKGYPIRMSDLSATVFSLAEAVGLQVRMSWMATPPADQTFNGGEGLFLTITPIQDLSDDVVFAEGNGNLNSYTLTSVAPKTTRVIIGGETTTGGQRYYEYRKNKLFDPAGWVDWDSTDSIGNRRLSSDFSDPGWGRQAIETEWNTTAEQFVDSRDIAWPFQPDWNEVFGSLAPAPGSDIAAQFASEALDNFVANGPTGLLTLDAIDTDTCQFGRDYNVGDVVQAQLDTLYLPESMVDDDGAIRQRVQEVTLSSSASDMWKIQPVVGTADSSPTPYIYKELKKLRAKVESDSQREELDPLAAAMPVAPSVYVTRGSFYGTVPTGGFATTDRPTSSQYYQVWADIPANPGDLNYVDVTKADLTLEFSTDGYVWTAIDASTANVDATGGRWWRNTNMAGVNTVHYWRGRVVQNGSVSPWSSNVPKLTVAAGPLNASGTLTLFSNASTYRWGTGFPIRGTDTTYGDLKAQYSTPDAPTTWFDATAGPPVYTTSTYSIPVEAPGVINPTTFNFRVISRDGTFTTIKTSNTITIRVIP